MTLKTRGRVLRLAVFIPLVLWTALVILGTLDLDAVAKLLSAIYAD